VLVDEEVGEGGGEEVEAQERARGHKGEEVAVVAPADAVVEPDAVVVLRLDAVVANAAVVGACGPPYVAALAVFGGDLHGSGGRVGREHGRPGGGGAAEGEGVLVGRVGWEGVKVSGEYLRKHIGLARYYNSTADRERKRRLTPGSVTEA